MFVTKDGLTYFFALLLLLATFHSTAEQKPQLPLSELQLFVDVYHQIRERYVHEISDDKLLTYAIEGMLQNLDPHSDFLSGKEYKDLRNNTSGEFAGLGFEVTLYNDFIKVIAPIDDTPASRAGIKSGDLIVKIDDLALQGLKMSNALDLLQGKKGSSVTLMILRDGESSPLEITLKREIIRIKSVKSKLLSSGYGYLKIRQFQKKTVYETEKHLKRLEKKNKGTLKGLVIDLRNNPGGLLHSAIELSDLFLDKGLITYTDGRAKNSREKFQATAHTIAQHTAIVILVNGGSASSSEIFAGALQDHKRAIIAGTKTFGKGSIQSILPLAKGRAIKLTTARYYTPSGRSIQAQGIIPDINIEPSKLTALKNEPLFKESELKGHLKKSFLNPDNIKKTQESLKLDDFQLYEALNLVKAMSLSARQSEHEQISQSHL